MSLSNKLAITDVDLKDKRVLIRVCTCTEWNSIIRADQGMQTVDN